jgi:hypothetical protein
LQAILIGSFAAKSAASGANENGGTQGAAAVLFTQS